MPAPAGPQTFDFCLDRTIHVRRNGQESSGPLTVGPVQWLPERGSWACAWSVHVIHPEEARIYGDDPIQALDRTLWFLTKFIQGQIEDGSRMWWQYDGDACGFGPPAALGPDPVPGGTLAYRTEPDVPLRFEGRSNHWLFIAFAAIAAANVCAAAVAGSDFGDIVWFFGSLAFCAAYIGLWVFGQIAFWTAYPTEPPRFTASALAALGVLAFLGVVGNILFNLLSG